MKARNEHLLTILSWNIAHRVEPWNVVARSDVDIALLQEAAKPPTDVNLRVGDEAWETGGRLHRRFRTAVVDVSGKWSVTRRESRSIAEAGPRQLRTSQLGTFAVADVSLPEGPITVVSVYAGWEHPVADTGSSWIYSDASAHRLLSDLSALIGQQDRHRLIVAGDLNLLRGYGENRSPYWARRYATVFDRVEALGLCFVGPSAPNGRQADPWPDELPAESDSVPTFHPSSTTPAGATRQLDFVFASRSIADRVSVRALNTPQEWGPSDHCRVMITVD